MPKRIQLPSAEDIFKAPGAVSAAAEPEPAVAPKPTTTPRSRAKKASPRIAPHASTSAPRSAATARQTRRPAAPAATVSHLDRVESSLRDLPIDTLIDLRDGLEDLLISERVDAGDLEQLLTSIGV